MPSFENDTQFDLIVPAVKATTHKQALLKMAKEASQFLNISEKRVFTRITEKEQITNSAIGDGIAVPHAKMRRVQSPFTLLMTVDKPIEWNTPDNAPLDLYCLLISPVSDGPVHLRRLSRLSRLLKNQTLHKRIRETKDKDVIQSLLIDPQGWLMAA